MTPFYEQGPWPERLKDGYQAMSTEHKKEFVRESIEQSHKREYLNALEWSGFKGPAWENLTEEQCENIRTTNRQHAQEMHEFGKSLGKS